MILIWAEMVFLFMAVNCEHLQCRLSKQKSIWVIPLDFKNQEVNYMEKFSLGKLVMTRAVHDKMNGDIDFAIGVLESFEKYRSCDWGDLCESDKAENEQALKDGERILALYNIGSDKIYIITERDRSVTTILFPYEY